MKNKNAQELVIGLVLFILGLAVSLTFNIFVLWANLEGMSFWGYPEALAFDSSLTAEARISSLRCPVSLAPGETGTVAVTVRNPNDYPIEAWVSAHISMLGMEENMLRELKSASLAPGEKSTLRWEVSEANRNNNGMILARIFLRLTERHPPARTRHCGIVTMDLFGLSSGLITSIALIGGHILQGAGIWMWWQVKRQSAKEDNFTRNVMIAMSIFSLLMAFGSLTHSWVISMLSLLLALLLVFTALGYGIGKSDHAIF
ncbi:MAG: hypothetical protein K0B06_04930 [Brevefilum sp.]|nr:hypothetical protein [Brevefilum sp.]